MELENFHKEPLSLKMILGDNYYNRSEHIKGRRELDKYIKNVDLLRINVCSRVILYFPPKKNYLIVVRHKKIYYVKGNATFYLNSLIYDKTYILNGDRWEKVKTFFYLNDLSVVL
jgi:hypothetical protein